MRKYFRCTNRRLHPQSSVCMAVTRFHKPVILILYLPFHPQALRTGTSRAVQPRCRPTTIAIISHELPGTYSLLRPLYKPTIAIIVGKQVTPQQLSHLYRPGDGVFGSLHVRDSNQRHESDCPHRRECPERQRQCPLISLHHSLHVTRVGAQTTPAEGEYPKG